MPFRPAPDPFGPLNNQLVNMLAQQQRAEKDSREAREREAFNLLQGVAEKNPELLDSAIDAFGDDVSQPRIKFLQKFGQTIKKSQKEAEQVGQITAARATGNQQRAGELFSQGLQGASGEGQEGVQRLQDKLLQGLIAGRTIQEGATEEDRRAVGRQNLVNTASERRQIFKRVGDSIATQVGLSDPRLGLSDDELDFDDALEAAREAGLPEGKAIEIASRAMVDAEAVTLKALSQARSTQGTSEGQRKVEFFRENIAKRFPGETITDNEAFGLAQTLLVVDPYLEEEDGTLFLIPTPAGEPEARKILEQRRSSITLIAHLDLAQDAFTQMREAAESGKITAGPGLSPGFFDILNFAGQQPGPVAAYRNASFLLVSTILKTIQGSRPSDFDLRMFMSLMPSTTEVFSDSADAKFDIMKKSMDISLRAIANPARAAEIRRIRAQPKTASERAAEAFFGRLQAKQDEGEALTEDDLNEAFKHIQRFKDSGRAQKFLMESAKQPSAISQKGADILQGIQ